MKRFLDSEGDLWVRTNYDQYRLAGSERHADALQDSGQEGVSLLGLERVWGPLTPVEDD